MGLRYVTATDGTIDPSDRGLAYGDGLFETMAVRGADIRFLDLHLDRLRAGAARLALPLLLPGELEQRLRAAIAGIDRGTVKLILTRGSGPRGYAPPPEPELTAVLLASASAERSPREISVVSLETRLAENVKLAGIKHLNRLEQVLARLELQDHAADEGLMLSTSGQVIGGTSRNLFAVVGGRVLTPDLRLCGVLGIMRQVILGACSRLGLAAETAAFGPELLARADEIFMSNALVGIQSVTRIDGRSCPSQAAADRLRQSLGLDSNA